MVGPGNSEDVLAAATSLVFDSGQYRAAGKQCFVQCQRRFLSTIAVVTLAAGDEVEESESHPSEENRRRIHPAHQESCPVSLSVEPASETFQFTRAVPHRTQRGVSPVSGEVEEPSSSDRSNSNHFTTGGKSCEHQKSAKYVIDRFAGVTSQTPLAGHGEGALERKFFLQPIVIVDYDQQQESQSCAGAATTQPLRHSTDQSLRPPEQLQYRLPAQQGKPRSVEQFVLSAELAA